MVRNGPQIAPMAQHGGNLAPRWLQDGLYVAPGGLQGPLTGEFAPYPAPCRSRGCASTPPRCSLCSPLNARSSSPVAHIALARALAAWRSGAEWLHRNPDFIRFGRSKAETGRRPVADERQGPAAPADTKQTRRGRVTRSPRFPAPTPPRQRVHSAERQEEVILSAQGPRKPWIATTSRLRTRATCKCRCALSPLQDRASTSVQASERMSDAAASTANASSGWALPSLTPCVAPCA